MSISKNCNNCAWFCHAEGKCYGTEARLSGIQLAKKPKTGTGCRAWSFDGLEEWEREDTLMTMGDEK